MSAPRKKPPRTINSDNSESLIRDYGKMPPQAVDLEEAVLGAIMLEKNAMEQVAGILIPEAFYVSAHQKIFQVFRMLFERGQPIDIVTVTTHLRSEGQLEEVGGPFFITRLTNRVGSAAHIEYHARLISQKHIQRELIRVSSEIQNEAFEESNDVFEILDSAEKRLFEIAQGNIAKGYSPIDDLVSKAIKQIEAVKNHKDGLSGVPSGLSKLDQVTAGWQKNNLIIVAARPGMGKTAFALTVARNAAVLGQVPVAIFSLEMESVELVTRLIASETMIKGEKLKKGDLEAYEWEQLNHKVSTLSQAPIYIDDTPALSVFQLRAKCRRLKAQHNIGMVVVDYLQLMKGDESSKATNREQEISYISRSLKALAKELGVPIMALAQLNREAEKRSQDKKLTPMLSDLRESGSIEQDADMVIFVSRPEAYGIHEDMEGNSTAGLADIIIGKHRNGPTASVKVSFLSDYTKFTDLETFDSFVSKPAFSGFEGGSGESPSVTITRPSRMNDQEDYF